MTEEKRFCQQREPWMTEDLERKLKATAKDNGISCDDIQKFAQAHDIEIEKMKPFLDLLGIKPLNCQLLCKE
jgi:hypothetical protein